MADLRALPNVEAEGDGQVGAWSEWIAPDQFYACTWEMFRQSARAYGHVGFDDEQLRHIADAVLDRPANHYGERWETNLAVAKVVYPDLGAVMFVEYPDDVVAAVKKYAAKGWRVHCGFWCDTNAWVPAQGPIVYSHAMGTLWDQDPGTVWRNPEPHPDVFLTNQEIRDNYDGGGILVFGRSLITEARQEPAPVEENMAYFTLGPAGSVKTLKLAGGGTIEVPLDVLSIPCWPGAQYNLSSYQGSEVEVGGRTDQVELV